MGDVLSGVVGALSGAVAGSLASWATSIHLYKKAHRQRQLDQVEAATDALKRVTGAYWRSSGRDLVAEEMIKSAIDELMTKVDRLLKAGLIEQGCADRSKGVLNDLWETATGGDFETSTRRANVTRAKRACDLCNEFYTTLTAVPSSSLG